MPLKYRTQERVLSFIYLGIHHMPHQELKSMDLSRDYNYHLVTHKMLLTVGIKIDPYRKFTDAVCYNYTR